MSVCPIPLTSPQSAASPPSWLERAGSLTQRLPIPFVLVAVGVALLTVAIRFVGVAAPFESSDQAGMPYMLRHTFGIRWLFEHDYGPILPLLQRSIAQVLSMLTLPMSEASYRWPIAMLDCLLVAMTYPLLRRLNCSKWESIAAAAVCAGTPALVCNAHFPWGYLSVWMLSGVVALWGTLAYLDERRRWYLLIAAVALFCHCTSCGHAFGLPIAMMAAWYWVFRRQPASAGDARQWLACPSWRAFVIGFAFPCVAALILIGTSYFYTGGGQLGHLLARQRLGVAGWHFEQLARLPEVWCMHFGYLWAPLSAIALVGFSCGSAGRLRLLVLWAAFAFVPVVLLADWDLIGYAPAYLVELIYVAAVLSGVGVVRFCARPGRRAILVKGLAIYSVVAMFHMTAGGADDILGHRRWHDYTGINMAWGRIRNDSGVKATADYVRRYVPNYATILVLHTNEGMELPVAEFYLGRQVLAGYDLKPSQSVTVLEELASEVDVIIGDPAVTGWNQRTKFVPVCTIFHDGQVVREIYARPTLNLPRLHLSTVAANADYDHYFQPRHIPIPLDAPPHFEQHLEHYQCVLAALKGHGPSSE